MILWLLVIIGLITYFILQRRVAAMTRTPIWILWLVLMMPALIWSIWVLIYGNTQPMPAVLIFGPFVICPLLYWWLIQLGQIQSPPPEAKSSEESPEASVPVDSGQPAASVRPITPAEEALLRDCFPWSIYYLQTIEYRAQAIICRGKLRTDSENAYQIVQQKIQDLFGERFLLVFRDSLSGKPFFALVINPNVTPSRQPLAEQLSRPALAIALLLITLFTSTVFGAKLAGFADEIEENSALLLQGLPYALSIMAILGINPIVRYFVARFYRIKTTLPYFVPLPYIIGTLGAFIQIRSPIPHRKALFDTNFVGLAASLVITFPLLIWGLIHSQVVELSPKVGIFSFEAIDPKFSLLLTGLSHWIFGKTFTVSSGLQLHPVALAAYIGLIITAFKLMPIGQLEGGQMVHAMFGQRASLMIGQITRFLMLILALVRLEFLVWALLLFLIPIDEPALNDVSELDNRRDFLGMILLFILALILLPAPTLLFN
jgi:membrane-associated protease RseP (regulator of RpoE activity)